MVISLEFNEVNFSLVKKYASDGELPNMSCLFKDAAVRETHAEKAYRELEPWIQWPSVYSGLTYSEHKVFRLGDIVSSNHKQIFEEVESVFGGPVVSISPMNARNELVLRDSVFVPDPWTKTRVKGPWSVRVLSNFVSRMVNNNSHQFKLPVRQLPSVLVAIAMNWTFSLGGILLREGFFSVFRPWRRSLVLDILLAMVTLKQCKRVKPLYGSVFLNACAHLQHHYLFSSKHYNGVFSNPDWHIRAGADPLLDGYRVYDKILGLFWRQFKTDTIYVNTGLSQVPNGDLVHYYRPKNHEQLLIDLGVPQVWSRVVPRMSRDFLVEFDSHDSAVVCEKYLAGVELADGRKLFSVDNRGSSLFCKVVFFGEPSTAAMIIGRSELNFS